MKKFGDLQTEEYGKRMAEARDAMGLSQTEAGKRLGRSRETISLIERGMFRDCPTPKEMAAFEEVYGITQIDQLALLGYKTNRPALEELEAGEAEFVHTLRRIPADLQRVVLRIAQSLSDSP